MQFISKKTQAFASVDFYAKALKIAVPVMAQLLIQNLVSLIDNFMVSGLGDVKMSGVNITGQIIFLFLVFSNTICMAGGIFMTQYSGAKDENGMRQTFCFKLWASVFVLAVYSVCCFCFPRRVGGLPGIV